MQWTYNDCTLNLRRRHLRECSHRSGLYLKCKCPLWAVGTVSGKFLRKSLDTRNLERGRDLLLELEKSGTPQMSLKEAMERFIAVKRQRRQSEDTVRKFERLRDELVEYFGNRSLEGISSDELDQFWEPWKLGVATIRKNWNACGPVLSFSTSVGGFV